MQALKLRSNGNYSETSQDLCNNAHSSSAHATKTLGERQKESEEPPAARSNSEPFSIGLQVLVPVLLYTFYLVTGNFFPAVDYTSLILPLVRRHGRVDVQLVTLDS
ncbi:hypothetical protein CBL_13678 [Carabus blaptoides fortunei]